MEKKKLEDLTREELDKGKKTLTGILIIMAVLIVLYAVFYIYRLATGTWERNNTLSIFMVGMLVVIMVMNGTRINAINAELKKRSET